MRAVPGPCLVSICLFEYNYFIIIIYFDSLVVGSNHELNTRALSQFSLTLSYYNIEYIRACKCILNVINDQ